jgi:hypothetical protein
MWDVTLRKLHAIRQTLKSGLGHLEMRQKIWEKQYWKGADQLPDQKLDFDEVEKMCRRLNINSSTEALWGLFKVYFTVQVAITFTKNINYTASRYPKPKFSRFPRLSSFCQNAESTP